MHTSSHSAASAAFHKSGNFVRQHNFQIKNVNFQSYISLQQTVYNSAYLLSTVIYCLLQNNGCFYIKNPGLKTELSFSVREPGFPLSSFLFISLWCYQSILIFLTSKAYCFLIASISFVQCKKCIFYCRHVLVEAHDI